MSNLNVSTEQFGEFSKTLVDSAMKFAKVSFDSAERIGTEPRSRQSQPRRIRQGRQSRHRCQGCAGTERPAHQGRRNRPGIPGRLFQELSLIHI